MRRSSLSTVETTPEFSLQWLHQGANANVSGYADSGQLFAIIDSPMERELDSIGSNLLKVLAGENKYEKPIVHVQNKSAVTSPTKYTQNLELLTQQAHQFAPGVYLSGTQLTSMKGDTRIRTSYIQSVQSQNLYKDLTVLETLSFCCELHNKNHAIPVELSILRLLTEMGFKDWGEKKIKELLRWQRRMVLFATEAVVGCNALFFDMPTKDLDAPSALALITALQRAASGGRLIVITMNSLTFREYAILDRVQILSSNGSIYLGTGAAAASTFAQMGRKPSPGASITDFLLDLIDDDMTTGEHDLRHIHFLESVANKKSLEETILSIKECRSHGLARSKSDSIEKQKVPVKEPHIIQKQPTSTSSYDNNNNNKDYDKDKYIDKDESTSSQWFQENLPILSPASVKSAANGMYQSLHNTVSTTLDAYISPNKHQKTDMDVNDVDDSLSIEESAMSISMLIESDSPSEHSLGSFLDSITLWTRNRDFCEEELQCVYWPGSTTDIGFIFRQFVLCLGRSLLIRYRNHAQVFSRWSFICLLVIGSLGMIFVADGDHDSHNNQQARATFLVSLPFILVLLANHWNEYSDKDRAIFSYEFLKGYYIQPAVFQLANLFADMTFFHLIPPLLSSAVLYPIVGLTKSWSSFFVYLRIMTTISVVACCMSKGVSAALELFISKDNHDKGSLVVSFLFSVQFLYSGLFLGATYGGLFQSVMRSGSFFYWGCNMLMMNEFNNDEKGREYLLSHEVSNEGTTLPNVMLFIEIIVIVCFICYSAGRGQSQKRV